MSEIFHDTKMNIEYLKSIIENSVSTEFERKVNMILPLIMKNYNSTRTVRDGKVDGLLYEKSSVSIISIYGPQKLDFNNFKQKVDEDYHGVIEFLKQTDCKLKKWFFIINKELSAEYIEYIKKKNNYSDNTYLITPTILISMIINQNKIPEVAMTLNEFRFQLPLEILRPDYFLQVALDKLCELKKEENREQILADLRSIIASIVLQTSPVEESHESRNILLNSLAEKDVADFFIPLFIYRKIVSETLIPINLRKLYLYEDGVFNQVKLSELDFQDSPLLICYKNLLPLYRLCNVLSEEVYSYRKYNIERALKIIHRRNEQFKFKERVNGKIKDNKKDNKTRKEISWIKKSSM